MESVVKNHLLLTETNEQVMFYYVLILMQFGKDIVATQDEKYSFVIEVASGEIDFQEIVAWMTKRVINK